jgi:hypothetical protein
MYEEGRGVAQNLDKAADMLKDLLEEDGQEIEGMFKQTTHTGPLSTSYKPKLDNTKPCTEDHASHFRNIMNTAVGSGTRKTGYSFRGIDDVIVSG